MRRNLFKSLFALVTLLLIVVGGYGQKGSSSSPGSGRWTVTNSMAAPREGACSAALLDGRLLIVGGAGARGTLATAEIYAEDGQFTQAAPMPVAQRARVRDVA